MPQQDACTEDALVAHRMPRHAGGRCGSPLHSMHGSRRPLRLQHRRQGGGVAHAGRDVDIADRAVASVPYLVPLLDGLRYGTRSAACRDGPAMHTLVRPATEGIGLPHAGKFLFAQFPSFAGLFAPLNPLINLYFSFPFARCGPAMCRAIDCLHAAQHVRCLHRSLPLASLYHALRVQARVRGGAALSCSSPSTAAS